MAGIVNHSREGLAPALRPLSAAAKRSIAEAEALFLSIGEAAIVTDADGKVSRINQTALAILDLKPEDIIGKWYPDVVVAENEAGEVLLPMERPITEMFITGRPVFRKLYFRKPGGSRVAVALTVSPVLVNGRPVGAIEIFRDISEEVALDKAKNEFIYLASHQLRTPATGVKQYIGLLLEGYAGQLTRKQRTLLRTANDSNERQLQIIDELLKVAAADSGDLVLHRENVDMVALLREVITEQIPVFQASRQKLTFTAAQRAITAYVDKSTIRMVMENLINNAHKYSYPGQKVTVAIRQLRRQVEVTVQDEGVGIDDADLGKLFKKFLRIDNPLSVSSGGTGLGLYWSKKIIDMHQGNIEVQSKPGKGTTFIITLDL